MKIYSRILMFLLILFIISQSLLGQGLPTAKPEEVGLASKRLDRIRPIMQSYADQNKLPDLITLVARHGKVVHCEKYGMQDDNQPMHFDTIFRIASMTKPITSVVILILYEEGYFLLDDPITKFIPEFNDIKVYSKMDKNELVLVYPQKTITIRDLLTHKSGLTYGSFGNTPVDSIYRKTNLFSGNLKEMIHKLSKIPLLYQLGTKWNYSVSTGVLGYLVEVISGKSFDKFLEERIFKLLGMKDTGFYVP